MLSHSQTRPKLYGWTPMRKLALTMLMAGAILMGMACGNSDDGEVEDVLKVRRLEVVDQNGVPRAVIEILDGGRPSIVLIDNQGAFRSLLFLSDDGSPNLVQVVDQNGVPRAVIEILDGGRPSIVLIDNQGVFRSLLFLSDDGSPNLVMLDNPRLALMDQNSEIRAAQHLDSNGQPVISLSDATGQVRSELRLGEDGRPSIRLFGDEGEVLWTPLPVESTQEP